MTPIQIMDEGIMIPIEYVGDAREFVVEVQENAVWLRPKLNGKNGSHHQPNGHSSPQVEETAPEQDEDNWLMKFVGIAETKDPTESSRVDEISPDESDEELTLEEIYERFPWMGTAKNLEPDASVRVEEILSNEIDPHSGWKLKSPLEESA